VTFRYIVRRPPWRAGIGSGAPASCPRLALDSPPRASALCLPSTAASLALPSVAAPPVLPSVAAPPVLPCGGRA
jgi:hypothetical protein